ncbi:MAG TPA: TraB/GumN family protein [Caulobacteraceae bacterium]|jgi:hypothetical protein
MSRLPAMAAAAALAAACAAHAEPAMWTVEDADTTIYLFGTVHVLRPELNWRTPRLDRALDSCADLTLEVVDDGASPAAAETIRRHAFSPDRPLSSHLTSAEQAELAQAAQNLGLDPAMLERARPWFAGLQLTVAAVVRAGYAPSAGVEKVIRAETETQGEPVRAFETVEEQIGLLASLPPEEELAFLRLSLKEYASAAQELDAMVKAWAAGDLPALDRLINADLQRESPRLYRLMLVDRNRRFAAKIRALLDQPGIHCVAVGAGHLVGADSVQVGLRALGVRAERF